MASVTDSQHHIPLRGWSERIVSLHMVALGVHMTPCHHCELSGIWKRSNVQLDNS
jgi:hypothetical protein